MKEIKGFEGRYSITTDGKVWSHKSNRFIKASNNGTGYYYLPLRKNGRQYGRLIHRLVAQAFIPNPYNKKTVNHKDCNKMNNIVSNLEWCSDLENKRHAVDNNLYESGEDRYNSKLTNKQVEEIRNLDKSNIVQRRIAEKYGVSYTLISLIINNKQRM